MIWDVSYDSSLTSTTSMSRLLRLCACCSIVSAVWCLGGRPGLPLFGFRPSLLGRLDLPDPLGLPGRRGTICLVESACTCLHFNRNGHEFAVSTAVLRLRGSLVNKELFSKSKRIKCFNSSIRMHV